MSKDQNLILLILWKLWIRFKYCKHFLNDYRNFLENTKLLEKLNRTSLTKTVDKKFYV